MYKTTTDLLTAAMDVLALAEKVTTREQHAALWDKKVDVLRAVNSALESGYFNGDSYNELHAAKSYLNQAENVAGKQALLTYLKEEK